MNVFDPDSRPAEGWRAKVYDVVFDTETPGGKLFDSVLLLAILVSIVGISLETVEFFRLNYRTGLRSLDWVLTILFTIEYCVRLSVVEDKRRYVFSVMGIVDLISIIPTYLSPFVESASVLQVFRALRLLRVFRMFRLRAFGFESSNLGRAMLASRYKIGVFLGTVLILVVIQGALLYFIEHEVNDGFSSIPRAIYWAIVTITTVGYGDISPVTVPGQVIASALMLLGYGIIAVPTGMVSAQLARSIDAGASIEDEDEVQAVEFELPPSPVDTCFAPVSYERSVHAPLAAFGVAHPAHFLAGASLDDPIGRGVPVATEPVVEEAKSPPAPADTPGGRPPLPPSFTPPETPAAAPAPDNSQEE